MKSSEKKVSQETKTTTSSHSKDPGPIKLQAYEYDPKDLEKFVKQYDSVDAVKDIKEAKKARTAIKKKINEIKRIHTGNKKLILSFKRNVEAYDLSKFETLTADLNNAFKRIDNAIEKIESGAAIRAQEVESKISKLSNDFTNDILNATTSEEINEVQVKIQSIVATPNDYDQRVGEVEQLKTSLTLKAAGRANEIANAGGSISKEVKPIDIQPDPLPQSDGRKYNDSDLLSFLQSNSAAKGWAVTINPNTGVAVYQVDDPKAPKDIRVAIEQAMENHSSI